MATELKTESYIYNVDPVPPPTAIAIPANDRQSKMSNLTVCCCCFSLRIGSLIITILTLGFNGYVAGANLVEGANISHLGGILYGVLYLLVALFSGYGFVVILFQKENIRSLERVVKLYFAGCVLALVAEIVVAIMAASSGSLVGSGFDMAGSNGRGWLLWAGILALVLLFQLYFVCVLSSYHRSVVIREREKSATELGTISVA